MSTAAKHHCWLEEGAPGIEPAGNNGVYAHAMYHLPPGRISLSVAGLNSCQSLLHQKHRAAGLPVLSPWRRMLLPVWLPTIMESDLVSCQLKQSIFCPPSPHQHPSPYSSTYKLLIILFVYFSVTLSCTQGFLLALCPEITSGWGSYGMP